jgi:hypothetical protein
VTKEKLCILNFRKGVAFVRKEVDEDVILLIRGNRWFDDMGQEDVTSFLIQGFTLSRPVWYPCPRRQGGVWFGINAAKLGRRELHGGVRINFIGFDGRELLQFRPDLEPARLEGAASLDSIPQGIQDRPNALAQRDAGPH